MRPAVLFGFVAAACSVAVQAEPRPVQSIEILVDVPSITVMPRPADDIALPSLTYAMTLTTYCDENWQPASVSISIADSRRSFNAEQLEVAAVLEVELQVPSNQIAPLPIEQFCIEDDQEVLQPAIADDDRQPVGTHDNKITIPAALSAQASLLCATESEQSITYVTKPLDVTLECSAHEPAAED